ncbi:Mss4-like protein [Podospora australis]|uniref:Mss4-like protein n=1 Tax=Podospora australis TaxID=1536484 RepID=A0AAN7AF02_9PEZI|nr:Mss4-like protein [Podospora australis]
MATPETKGLPASCECGYIRLTTPPQYRGMAHCHCTTCQKQSGSAFGTSLYFASDEVFPLPKDVEEKLSVYTHLADSGNTMRCYFCPKCGVRMMHSALLPDGTLRPIMSFKAGTIDGELDWKALKARHIFTRSAKMPLAAEWECFEGYPPDMAQKPKGEDGGKEKEKGE